MKVKTKGIKQEGNGLLKKSKDAAENVKDNLTRIEEVADKAEVGKKYWYSDNIADLKDYVYGGKKVWP